MRDALVLALLIGLVVGAIVLGGRPRQSYRSNTKPLSSTSDERRSRQDTIATPLSDGRIPSVGSIQVLNGCGIDLAGVVVADFLRTRGFDVKNVGNAPSWNYPATIVVSRISDMRHARMVAAALANARLIMLRTGDELYDVTVFVGPDYREKTR